MKSKIKIIFTLMILTLLLITACKVNSLSSASKHSDASSDQIANKGCAAQGDVCPIDFGTDDYKGTCGLNVSDKNNDGVCDIN